MKHQVSTFLVIFSIAVLALQPVHGKDAPTSEKQLLEELEKALRAKDKDAVISLVSWIGVPTEMKALQVEIIEKMLKEDVKSVNFAPMEKSDKLNFELNGVRYTPNVYVLGSIAVEFIRGGNPMLMPYGKKDDGAWYIMGSAEYKSDAQSIKNRTK